MKTGVFVTTVFMLALLPSISSAHFYDGNRLLENLMANQRVSDNPATVSNADIGVAFELTGYIKGVSDSHDGTDYCVPKSASVLQLIKVVKKRAFTDHSELSKPASYLVARSLRLEYPCKK